MGKVNTNDTGVLMADEASLGTLPGSPVWYELEPNNFDEIGAKLTTTPRRPISKNRQRRKGKSTKLESSAKLSLDSTLWHFVRLLPYYLRTVFIGGEVRDPSSVDATEYTVDAGTSYAAGTLVLGRGFGVTANNGLKEVDTGSSGTTIPVVGGLSVEASPPANAVVEEAGVRGATGDLEIDSNGDLISTTLDFTTLRIEVGQFIHVGGLTSTNQFATAADTGRARVVSVAANLVVLDRKETTFVADSGAGKRIDILFGRFLKNVAVDDADYAEITHHLEVSYPNLDSGGATEYEYPKGNLPDKLTLNVPLGGLSTMEATWTGTDTETPSTTRKTGASSAIPPLGTDPYSTATDITRLRVFDLDEIGLTTDIKSVTLEIGNGTSGEDVLAQLGPKYINQSLLVVDAKMQLVFTSSAVTAAIRANTSLSMEIGLRSDDGEVILDIPELTLGDGGKEFPVDKAVLINATAGAHADTENDTSITASFFPIVP